MFSLMNWAILLCSIGCSSILFNFFCIPPLHDIRLFFCCIKRSFYSLTHPFFDSRFFHMMCYSMTSVVKFWGQESTCVNRLLLKNQKTLSLPEELSKVGFCKFWVHLVRIFVNFSFVCCKKFLKNNFFVWLSLNFKWIEIGLTDLH